MFRPWPLKSETGRDYTQFIMLYMCLIPKSINAPIIVTNQLLTRGTISCVIMKEIYFVHILIKCLF